MSSVAGSEAGALRWRESGLVWLVLAAVLLGFDQWTKLLALDVLEYAVPVPVFPGLDWKLVYNHGAAFSLLASASGWQRWFFLTLAVVISVVLTIWLRRLPRIAWNLCLPLALIVSVAIGNAIDRVLYGYVVDFIHVYWREWSWPVFNIADSAISVGAVLLILYELGWLGAKREQG
ncbi:MAG: signal peptidase II [Xanthomonadales bacterium]|nr:signal peptidase II [Xanthomonadales bacterium]